MTSFLKDGRSQTVALWLIAVTAVVFCMVVVGGTTRLTGSGLSITEWKPVSGVLPPLSEADWRKGFALYQATPQYRQVNAGMTLAEFKAIFWWEWFHRLLGRLAGLVFALPFFVLLALRQIPLRLIWRCVILLALGGLQGLVGWWMVQSGLEHRVSVAPERLAAHLGLALILFCALIWTAMEAWSGQGRGRAANTGAWPLAATAFFAAVFCQCLLGALVAGNQAGLVDNDWPLMNGYLFPPDYAKDGVWATLAHSQAAVQFNHRMAAYGVVIAAVGLASAGLNSRLLMGQSRGLALAVGVLAVFQALLGVATLMTRVPLALALGHQAGAAALLAIATALMWRVRRP
ncbi:MAG TPA: COX15/CtaA family protein [Caulobacteraceae bacterium]|nr:COX15/CtaA family protein [Caulobacteraceae bacterium]